MVEPMKRADYCAVCGDALNTMSLQLQQQEDLTIFCSLECVVTYAVGQIRQRLELRNSQVSRFASEQKKLRAGRHAKRGERSTVA